MRINCITFPSQRTDSTYPIFINRLSNYKYIHLLCDCQYLPLIKSIYRTQFRGLPATS